MILGFQRANGSVGARNHVLVLPSVVCSCLTAETIAAGMAVSITHQHGCAVVGDDVEHSHKIFTAMASHPNVASALVVGLGCETIQGESVADAANDSGAHVRYLGIQAGGGTRATTARGRELVGTLVSEASELQRVAVDESKLTIGLDDADAPFAAELSGLVQQAGAQLLMPVSGHGAEVHPDLAAAGAQIIVAWCRSHQGPRGFAICPVISVAGDASLYAAMPEDFDLEATDDPNTTAQAIFQSALVTFDGSPTRSEDRGSSEFFLRRLARTM